MSGISRKLVCLLAGVAFLIANTPVTGASVRCPWILSGKAKTAAPPACSCCCHDAVPQDSPTDQTADSCPACPQVPVCPFGCCWASVGKVPCFFSTFSSPPTLLPSLDQDLAEASLFIPAAPCGELIRPPKV